MASDQSWAEVARATRDALALLGRPITPRCLPDEADPCGGTFADHAAAHLATIKAVADHQLLHLGPEYGPAHSEIYWEQCAELHHDCMTEGTP